MMLDLTVLSIFQTGVYFPDIYKRMMFYFRIFMKNYVRLNSLSIFQTGVYFPDIYEKLC